MTVEELEKQVRKEQRKNAKKQKKNRLILWLCLGLVLCLGGLAFLAAKRQGWLDPHQESTAGTFPAESFAAPEDGIYARVCVIDVGQGSALLIESGGEFLLVDGGGSKVSSRTVAVLKERGVTKLKALIVTHYDGDHVYGAVGALEAFGAETIFLPDYTEDSAVYASFQRHLAAHAEEFTLLYPKPRETYQLGYCQFTFLAPCSDSYEKENDRSLAFRLMGGGQSLLVTGDAEALSEAEMVDNNKGIRSLASDVLIAGHHGSGTSSTAAFLKAVSPKYAVISCGKDNEYGHPAESVLRRLKLLEIELYRTDLQGDIVFLFTDNGIRFEQEPCSDYTPGQGKEKP